LESSYLARVERRYFGSAEESMRSRRAAILSFFCDFVCHLKVRNYGVAGATQ